MRRTAKDFEVGDIIHVEQKTMNGTPYIAAVVEQQTAKGIRACLSAAAKIGKKYHPACDIVLIPSHLVLDPDRPRKGDFR